MLDAYACKFTSKSTSVEGAPEQKIALLGQIGDW